MKKTERVLMAIDPLTLSRLRKLADTNGRSLASYIRWLINRDYDATYRLTEQGKQALEEEKQHT